MRLYCYLTVFLLLSLPCTVHSQDKSIEQLAKLPGGTLKPAGHLETEPMDLDDGPECEKGMIVVPENRAATKSRNIKLYYYRLKARKASGRSPVFMLPGGPGGYFDDHRANRLRSKPSRGSGAEVWRYTQDRDVILMNQRGARLPDRSFMMFGFFFGGTSFDKPYSTQEVAAAIKYGAERAIKHRSEQGIDLAGYDIMNMVEDINELRHALGYEKITLRGNSFGSQWSFAYMQQYPQFVDRAVLGGIEPLDYGYDSPNGVWNVFKRIEAQLEDANGADNRLNLPDVSLTNAIKKIVERLGTKTVEAEAPGTDKKVLIGPGDFQRFLRTGINARRESPQSLSNFHRFVFEVYNEDMRFVAMHKARNRNVSTASLQTILIDNSLGISDSRDQKLDKEKASQWTGELNTFYKATREISPSPEIPDSFRQLKTDLPILFVQGDMDLSTPIENALEVLPSLSNCHLIRITRGTHAAFDQISDHDPTFFKHIEAFLNADFHEAKIRVKDLGLPMELTLPPLEFKPVGSPSLYDEQSNAEDDSF